MGQIQTKDPPLVLVWLVERWKKVRLAFSNYHRVMGLRQRLVTAGFIVGAGVDDWRKQPGVGAEPAAAGGGIVPPMLPVRLWNMAWRLWLKQTASP